MSSQPGLLGLDEIEPGAELAMLLAHIDEEALTGFDQVAAARALARQVAHYQARLYRTMAVIYQTLEQELEGDVEDAFGAAAAELRPALSLTRRAADSELSFALDLKWRLPAVGEAMIAGKIDLRRARVMVYATSHLPEQTARLVIDRIIESAPGLTSGQLNALICKLRLQIHPEDAADRYREAVSDRWVVLEPTTEGTANLLGLDLPPDLAAEAINTINRLARQLKTADEERSLDQIRADVLLDLLAGRSGSRQSGPGSVDLQVDLTTLAELNDHPAELAGYGPVIADIARQVAERQTDAQWHWTVTDPGSGAIIAEGSTRRRPTTAQRREVQARHRTCIFPGVSTPSPRLRPRPPHSLGPGRAHPGRPPPPPLPSRPRGPPPLPLEIPPAPRRPPAMDQPPGTHLHHRRTSPLTISRHRSPG
jgi:hypothetical protein